MENKKLNLLVACLEDVLNELEELSAENNDFILDEVAEIKQLAESIKDSGWKA